MARVGAGYEEFFDPKTKSKWQRKVCALMVEWQDLWWNSAYSTYNNYCYSLLRMILMCMTCSIIVHAHIHMLNSEMDAVLKGDMLREFVHSNS